MPDGTPIVPSRFWDMERRNNKIPFGIVTNRLRLIFQLLRDKFAHQAEDDVKRAEEQHRGRNEPLGQETLR
jgi:hypothetical protein